MIRVTVRLLFIAVIGLAIAACQTQGSGTVDTVNGVTDSAASQAESDSSSAEATSEPARTSAARYFIEFRSRYALSYGHSFVIFGRLDANGRMIDPEVAGLAPESEDPSVYMLGHVTPVPASTGWTDGDLDEDYMSANWRVMLDESEYREVVAYIRKLQASSPLWHAALYNCNAFVGKIARSMGYKAPFHWLPPQEYITKLREMNGGPDAIGYTRPTASTARVSAGSGR